MNTPLKTKAPAPVIAPKVTTPPAPAPLPQPQAYIDFADNLHPLLNDLSAKIDSLKRDFAGILLRADGLAKSNAPLSPADQPTVFHLAESIRSFSQQVAALSVPLPPATPSHPRMNENIQ